MGSCLVGGMAVTDCIECNFGYVDVYKFYFNDVSWKNSDFGQRLSMTLFAACFFINIFIEAGCQSINQSLDSHIFQLSLET